jgi:hypothetical protein
MRHRLFGRSGRRVSELCLGAMVFGADPDDPTAGGSHRKSLRRGIDASLKRLGTDYIDLYYVHIRDPLTRVKEVVCALDDLVHAGKVRDCVGPRPAGSRGSDLGGLEIALDPEELEQLDRASRIGLGFPGRVRRHTTGVRQRPVPNRRSPQSHPCRPRPPRLAHGTG